MHLLLKHDTDGCLRLEFPPDADRVASDKDSFDRGGAAELHEDRPALPRPESNRLG